jgi:DNA-binding IclR family transcriptional regulator
MSTLTKVRGTQAIARAVHVLRAVAGAQGTTAAEAARALRLPRSTVVRMLSALEAEGLVRVSPATGRYEVGPGVLELASRYLTNREVRQVALPFLWELAQTTRETVNLAIQDGLDSICIEQVESPEVLRAVNWIGQRLPVHATSTGKAWLAFQPEREVETLLCRLGDEQGRLPACTERTLTDPQALRLQLAQVRQAGYATAHEELAVGLVAVAAPVFSHDGVVAATIAVSGPSFRLPRQRLEKLAALTVTAAQEVSSALGYRRQKSTRG